MVCGWISGRRFGRQPFCGNIQNKIALKPLFYFGIEDPNLAIKWTQSYVCEKNSSDYYTSKQGRDWIENCLVNKSEIIAGIFEEIDIEDNAE